MKKYKLEGLDCADCAIKLEQKLLEKDYVNEVSISFTTGTMIIDTKDIEKVKEDITNIESEVKLIEDTKTKSDLDAIHEIEELSKEKMLIIISGILFLVAFITEVMQKLHYIYYDTEIFFNILYIVAYTIIGIPILIGAYKAIVSKNYFDEKVLMSISTIAAFFIGYFEEACGVMLFYAIGEYFQDLALINSRKDIKNLLEFKEKTVNLVINKNEEVEVVRIEDINVGNYILIKPGEKVPLDGIIVKGSGEFNLSNLTGESKPKHIDVGESVYSGSINISSNVLLKVTSKYEDSSMFKLVELIENSMHKKTKADRFITTFSKWYTPTVILLSILVAILPPIFTRTISFEKSIYSAIVLLVISCPCALVLSIPLTYFTGLGYLAKKGVLVKDISVFDKLEKINSLFIDKTGTLTEGNFDVSEIDEYFDELNISEKEIFEHIYIAENGSNHPIAKSVINFIRKKYGLTKVEYNDVYMEFISYCQHCGCCHKPLEHNEKKETFIEEYRHHIGHFDEDLCINHEYEIKDISKDDEFAKGIKVISLEERAGEGMYLKTDKYEVLIGNDIMMKRNKVHIPKSAENVPNEYGTNINIAFDGHYIMNIYVKDKIKNESKKSLQEIRKNGINNIILLTGDNKNIAMEVKNELLIDECYYNLLPHDKLEILEKYSVDSKTMFVGDGMNDAPAIARADVGIAMGKNGSDISIGTADVVFTTDSISKISLLKTISNKMKKIIYQNISIILLVKFIVIVFGILGKANLWIAVFGDVGVAIVAILNSKRIKNK